MGTLNFQYSLLGFEDLGKSNPQIRNMDISQTFQDVATGHENTVKIVLAPGQKEVVAATARQISSDSSTKMSITRPVSTASTMRLSYAGVGSAPNFRVRRNLGTTSATKVSIQRVGPASARLILPGCGTASVETGDILSFSATTDSFSSPFSAPNAGQKFIVQGVGPDYVDFVDNGAAALDFEIQNAADAFEIISSGPVRRGDTLLLAGQLNGSNAGEFQITDVGSSYVEYINPFGVEEDFYKANNTVCVYDHAITFVHISSPVPVKISFDNLPSFQLGGIGTQGPALFVGSVRTWQIEAQNDGTQDAAVTIRHLQAY
jgi:hypothetical protein